MNIAVFYHCLFVHPDTGATLDHAVEIAGEQMSRLRNCGLIDGADVIYAGINGGKESEVFADNILPEKAIKVYHGRQCRTENRTIMLLQQTMAGLEDFAVLYLHTKGAFYDRENQMVRNWRRCMMDNLVRNWRGCVADLGRGFDSVGCHWQPHNIDGSIAIWAGNFWWATSRFLSTIPALESHPRVVAHGGVDPHCSRYEAECWIGEGPRLPNVLDYHNGSPFMCPP